MHWCVPPHAPPGDATELSSDIVHARWGTGHCGDRNYAFRYSSAGHKEGSPRGDRVGGRGLDGVCDHIMVTISKKYGYRRHGGGAMLKGPGESHNSVCIASHSSPQKHIHSIHASHGWKLSLGKFHNLLLLEKILFSPHIYNSFLVQSNNSIVLCKWHLRICFMYYKTV